MIHAQTSCYPADICAPSTTIAVPPPAPSAQNLAFTGGNSVSPALIALALIIIGLTLIIAIRRRANLA